MADTLFTQLPVAVALTGSEVVPVDQPNANPPGTFTTKRTTTGEIARTLSPTNAVNVILVTDTAHAIAVSERASLLSFSNVAPMAATLPASGVGSAFANPAWFCQIENRGTAALTISPSGTTTIDGASSLVLTQDQGVVIAVGPDNNWYTQRGAGLTALTAVTSVGLAAPGIFTVSGSPVTNTGTLTFTLNTQAANLVWAGPTTGAAAAPSFRSLVTADLPMIGAAGTYGSATAVPVITTDATGRVSGATTAAIVPGSIGSVAASSLLGNATGAPAAATSISIGATFAFSGTTIQTTAGTGDVTWAANSYATTIALNAVTYAKFQQVAALSLVGNSTNATANAAAITAASDGQVMRRSGTAIGFGAVDLTSANAVSGALPAANGGTGLSLYAVGDLVYASGTTTLARLADVATGNALISGGVGVAPLWGKIGLTTHVSGTLPVANGGTGATTATAYAVLCGGTTTTSPFQSIASVGTAGQILTSNGAGALPTFQNSPGAPSGVLSNVGISASVAASALTITLTTAAGATPSATDIVSVPYRSSTEGTGTITQKSITSSLSLTISSGSTIGFISATAARAWLVVFDDAGTDRLGLINCRSGNNVYPLAGYGVASSTAEGGAGGADSAQVFYTGTAVTTKAYTVLGYMEWSAGLTTAGTWAIVPTRIEVMRAGVRLPGMTVQQAETLDVTTRTTTSATLVTTNITAALSPSSAANLVRITMAGGGDMSATNNTQGFDANRNGTSLITLLSLSRTFLASFVKQGAGAGVTPVTFGITDYPQSTSAVTYTLMHNASSGTATLGARDGGLNTEPTLFRAEEIMT